MTSMSSARTAPGSGKSRARQAGIEFWAAASDGREILFQDNNTGKLRAISLASAEERAVATSPRAPLTDSFGDGVRDSSIWHRINDAGGSIGETGGRLVATISGAAVPGGAFNQVDEHFGSMCSLTGDFDYSVNYELLQWPHLGGFRANLAAFFANGSIRACVRADSVGAPVGRRAGPGLPRRWRRAVRVRGDVGDVPGSSGRPGSSTATSRPALIGGPSSAAPRRATLSTASGCRRPLPTLAISTAPSRSTISRSPRGPSGAPTGGRTASPTSCT